MLIFSPSASTPWSTHRVFFLSFFCCSPKPVCGEGRKLVCTTISNVLVITVTDLSFLLLPFWFGEEGQAIDSCISPRYYFPLVSIPVSLSQRRRQTEPGPKRRKCLPHVYIIE